MALLKCGGSGYHNNWTIDTGDNDFNQEMGEQLELTNEELSKAINAENVADRLFARIVKIRKAKHEKMMTKFPGTTEE